MCARINICMQIYICIGIYILCAVCVHVHVCLRICVLHEPVDTPIHTIVHTSSRGNTYLNDSDVYAPLERQRLQSTGYHLYTKTEEETRGNTRYKHQRSRSDNIHDHITSTPPHPTSSFKKSCMGKTHIMTIVPFWRE